MTKTKILHTLAEQMSRQYKMQANYAHRGEDEKASEAHGAAWAIYWCGLELLGDGYRGKLDEVRQSARESGERFARMLQEQFDS
jgi:hypothetical protein